MCEGEIKSKVEELKIIIEKYNNELKKVRESCEHKDIKVDHDRREDGSVEGLRVFCDNCGVKLGYPNINQLKEYDEKNNIGGVS